MFRLSKGNQSRKNHKIIHQTTKVSEADAPLSTPAQEAQRHAQELMKQQQLEQEAAKQAAESQKQAETVTEKIINETVSQKLVNSQTPVAKQQPVQPFQDMESYILKMREYMVYMKELEERNAKLEHENLRYKAENAELKGQLLKPTNTAEPYFPITETIRANHHLQHS